MKYLIDAKAFLNVLPFVSTDVTRINIQAVQIRASRIWATNGHLAIAHRLEQMDAHDLPDGVDRIDQSTTFCITVDDVKRLTTFIKTIIKDAPRWDTPYICYDTTSPTMSDIRGKTTMMLGEYKGEYPDVLKILPKSKSLQPISHLNVSGGYVGQLAALVGKGALGGMVEIYGTGGLTEPLIVRPESGAWLAVVMPCHLSKDEVAAREALEDLHADLTGRARPTRLSEEGKQP